MDAQQRLLLEHSWEVLQHKAVAEDNDITSVIVGIGTVDYTGMASHLGVGIYVATGGISLHALFLIVGQTWGQRPSFGLHQAAFWSKANLADTSDVLSSLPGTTGQADHS